MADETTTKSLIYTKLHRPPVGPDFVSRPHLLQRLEKHRQRPLALVLAPAGYGKSTLVSGWLESCDCPGAWVSLDKNDNNLQQFLSYFLAAVRKVFPDAGLKTLAMVNAPILPSVSILAGSLLNELEPIERPFIMVLDDYHHIQDESVHDLLTRLLNHPPQSLHLVLVGRRDPALPIYKLRAKGLVTEIRTMDLRFTKAETASFLEQMLRIQIDPTTVAALEEKTEGWVTGLRLAVLSMRHRGNIDPSLLEPQVDTQYVMEYLFNEVFAQQPPGVTQYLLGSAILDRFCGSLCEAVCAPGADPFSCETSGWEFISWLKREKVFLITLDPENRWFRYHHLFQKLLVNQLNRRCSAEAIKALHVQASAWFAENGLLEEALQHALAAGKTETAGSLVARFSHQLLNKQQWQRLEQCLHLLSQDQIKRDPALLVLVAWLQLIRQNTSGIKACLEGIKTLKDTSPPNTLVNVEHVQGHFDLFLGIQHYMDAEGNKAVASLQRARKAVPLQHMRARLMTDLFQLVAYQMIGEPETGLQIYQEAMHDCISRETIYGSAYLLSLGFFYWMDADLELLRHTAKSALRVLKDKKMPEMIGIALYFQGIVHYHRNELHKAEEKLAEVINEHRAISPMNFARSSFALSLTYQTLGNPYKARETANAVITDAIETNSKDRLKAARAFEAELALRQGRLDVAFRWATEFQALPFRPSYGFFLPQITLIRTLLVQGTADNLQQAADLLDQLHDFLVSIHNNCFQIDVLALKALLYDTRGEGPAALESLTCALKLAEPGGFIRLFVDLGPRMAHLLKLLINQNVAAGYIGRILAAFKEDEHRTVPDTTDQNSSSPRHPLRRSSSSSYSTFHTSQPLVEPLTNRELEILNLLAQRLQNKEIAAKLFISPETVKKHLYHIYGKLNVRSRWDAVEKAQSLDILPLS